MNSSYSIIFYASIVLIAVCGVPTLSNPVKVHKMSTNSESESSKPTLPQSSSVTAPEDQGASDGERSRYGKITVTVTETNDTAPEPRDSSSTIEISTKKKCERKLTSVTMSIGTCHKRISVYNCFGSCTSRTVTNPYGKLDSICRCCQPVSVTRTALVFDCPELEEPRVRYVESANACRCRPCAQ